MGTYIQTDALNRSIEHRRTSLHQQHAIEAKIMRVSGFVTVSKAGETSQDVNFPVAFAERPTFSSGFELGPSDSLVDGKFPMCTVGVARWRKESHGEAEFFVGATLVIVSTGPAEQQLIAHWQVEGKALRNPLGGSTDAI